ncbi:MAG: DNA mismatch repair endonuclease MutL [Gemmatimonadales bacterium]|nr:MAG: DNA mismatch repair endonuclease MutL [Gemmatimonadales bacterium]
MSGGSMSRTIQILPDAVANQIAAGEVVERPASVAKELVENAVDARAERIEVRIERGGKRSIRVADDGVGMSREDALLSLDRHATSKIRKAEDLRGVRSFGFRGEALPSIASVSRLAIETRRRADPVGTRISVRGGTVLDVRDHPRNPGTTILVENLFFNAPARSKFLRAPGVESRAVSEALIPIALANPALELILLSDDRPLLELPASPGLGGRVAAIWGVEAASGLIATDHEVDGIRVQGLIQRPDATRPGFRRSQLFVAGRPFRDPGLLSAAGRGYRTTIPADHRPWIFLFLSVPDGSVDVNVHPTKAEVRFDRRERMERVVEEAVRNALEGLASSATFDAPRPPPEMRVREQTKPPPEAADTESQMALFLASGSAPHDTPGEAAAIPADTADGPRAGPPERGYSGSGEGGAGGADTELLPTDLELRPRLWQVHRAWIMAEVRDGLLLIDQHAAHERVLFERIMAGFDREGAEAQRLLFPLTIRLPTSEVEMVEDLKGLLQQAGFEVEFFGGDTVILHAVPNPHPYFDAEKCFREMIEELTNGSELVRSARNQHERVAMSFACKAAIKAGQELSAREIQELFDQLFATQLPYHDVHGRPTTVRLSRAELERKFGR